MRKEHVLGKTRRDFMVRLLCREQRYARALARVEMNKSEKRRVRTRGSGDTLDYPSHLRVLLFGSALESLSLHTTARTRLPRTSFVKGVCGLIYGMLPRLQQGK